MTASCVVSLLPSGKPEALVRMTPTHGRPRGLRKRGVAALTQPRLQTSSAARKAAHAGGTSAGQLWSSVRRAEGGVTGLSGTGGVIAATC